MSISMKVSYSGNLHCEATHLKSGTVIATDAPVDNNGKGESFSPTDLTCVSLASCIITTMGIAAQLKSIPFGKIDAEIEKIMASNPRRIQEIVIKLTVSEVNWNEKERAIMENIAGTCPVARSLHPDTKQSVSFHYL